VNNQIEIFSCSDSFLAFIILDILLIYEDKLIMDKKFVIILKPSGNRDLFFDH
jgi:hypothetical protein